MSSRVDIYADIRHHADRAGSKYLHENVVLTAVDELLDSQDLKRTPVAYLGALMMSLQAEERRTEPATYAGMLTLLERALSADHVPRAVLLSKAPRIAAALVAVANTHAEHPPVLKGALSCVLRIFAAQPPGAAASSDSLKLFHWLLTFVIHTNPKVRARGQQACCSALEQCPALSDAAARFVEQQLATAGLKDVQPTLHVLGFLHKGLGALRPKALAAAANAILRLPSLGHPLLSRSASDVMIELCAGADSEPLPAPLLSTIAERMLQAPTPPNGGKQAAAHAARVDPSTLRAAAAAVTALVHVDVAACHSALPALVSAWIACLMREQLEHTNGGGSSSGETDLQLTSAGLCELLAGCVRPSMASASASDLGRALLDGLGPRYLTLREGVLEACAELFTGLSHAATPSCDPLLKGMAAIYADITLGSARPVLLASLGRAAKAIGPERFVAILPVRVSTDGGEDTSWLLAALRHHIGNAKLAFFGSYFLPLAQWLESRAGEMEGDKREIEGRNLRNMYEQVWALLPGFAGCARDVSEALPPIARLLGVALAERPEVRGHILGALSLMVQSARSRKEPVVSSNGGGGVELALAADAQAALSTVGRFGKNFLPLIFNIHQAEPAEKRPPLQEAVSAVASVTPDATLGELFKTMLRRLLEPALATDGGPAPADPVEAQRGLLDLLIALSPSLDDTHVGLLARAVKPLLLSTDVLMQKKAYKVLGAISAHHPSWVRNEVAPLLESMKEALPACSPGCKGKRLACLQSVVSALPAEQLAELLPSLLGEVVLATKEVNVKTRAAAFEFLVGLSAAAERRAAAGGAAAKAQALRSLVVMVAGGLAGNTPHMMAATLSALGRLTYELRGRPDLEPTLVELFTTVLALLQHGAQEVAKAAISYVKVGLFALPVEAVQPLLPRLVPPMLTWCTNKHPHLKTQVRYVIERLVKRFGHEEMSQVTPEAHQRLLVHLRKQKVRAHNHAVARRQERDERRAMSLGDAGGEEAAEMAARRERHEEYEALLEDEGDDDADGEAGDGNGAANGAHDGGASKGRSDKGQLRSRAAAAAAFASRHGSAAGQAMANTWKDRDESAADLDLLSAPLVPSGAGKRRRDGSTVRGAPPSARHASNGAEAAGGATSARAPPKGEEDGGIVRLDEEGKLVVLDGRSGAAATERLQEKMEVDPEDDEIIRPDSKKRRKLPPGSVVVPASKAEEAETEALAAAKRAERKGGNAAERNKRRLKPSASAQNGDHFGANFGDSYKGRRGASGDVIRKGGSGVQPYAYLPLNPRMLGKKQQRKASETMGKLLGPAAKGKKSAAKATGVVKKALAAKHGLQKRREKSGGKKR